MSNRLSRAVSCPGLMSYKRPKGSRYQSKYAMRLQYGVSGGGWEGICCNLRASWHRLILLIIIDIYIHS